MTQSIGTTDGAARPSRRYLAALLMTGAFLSKVLGFVRELIMAQVLGASLIADGFRGAMAAALIPLAFLQGESVPAILVPMHQAAQREGDAARHLAAVTVALTLIAVVLTIVVQALGAWWVAAVVGGFGPEGQALTLEFVRVMALGMPGATVLNCLAAGEIALGRSRLTNLRAAVLNVAVILGLGVLALTGFTGALAWSFMIAFDGLALWAFWSLWRNGDVQLAGLGWRDVAGAGCEFFRRLRPIIALPVVERAQLWIERALASRLSVGAVASLDYARTLTESALLVISQPVGLAVLSHYAPGNTRAQVEAIVRPVLAVALPTSVFLFVFAPDIVRLVFMRGAFTEAAVDMTSQALRGISVGLWAATLGWILLRLLNGAARNGLAALILTAAYGVNVIFIVASADLQRSSGLGLFILGLGEAARGLVLLFGIALALECGGRILQLVLLALVPAVVMAIAGWHIHESFTGTGERLLIGGCVCALSIALAAAILMPEACRAGFAVLRTRLSTMRET